MLSGFSPDAGGDTPASRDERIPGLSVFIYGKRVNNHMETGLPGHFDVTGGPVSYVLGFGYGIRFWNAVKLFYSISSPGGFSSALLRELVMASKRIMEVYLLSSVYVTPSRLWFVMI